MSSLMSELLTPADLIPGYGRIEPAWFQGVPTALPELFQLIEDPELIIRAQRMLPRNFSSSDHLGLVGTKLHEQGGVIRTLHNDYSINSPGFIVLGQVKPDQPYVYTATQRVHGSYFTTEQLTGLPQGEYQLDKIPEKVTVKAFDSIVSYYEDVVAGKTGPLYLADVRLGNLIYGGLKGDDDHQAGIYLFDFENQHFFDISLNEYWPIRQSVDRDFHQPFSLYNDLQAMQQIYGKEFAEFGERLRHLFSMSFTAVRNQHSAEC